MPFSTERIPYISIAIKGLRISTKTSLRTLGGSLRESFPSVFPCQIHWGSCSPWPESRELTSKESLKLQGATSPSTTYGIAEGCINVSLPLART